MFAHYTKPEHYLISKDVPTNFSREYNINIVIHVLPGLFNIPFQVIFESNYQKLDGTDNRTEYSDSICDIPGDAFVKISISTRSSVRCRWSDKHLAITAKCDYSEHLGGIYFVDNDEDTANKDEFVTFCVKKRPEYDSFRHLLNLNVAINTGQLLSWRSKWTEMTLDPEIINPRPVSRILLPLGDGFMNPDDEMFDVLSRCSEDSIMIMVAPECSLEPPRIPIDKAYFE